MPKSSPYFPNKPLTYGQLFFFIKQKTYNINPFDKESIQEAKSLILKEAKKASPDNEMFIKAAKLATRLSERSIKSLIYIKLKETK